LGQFSSVEEIDTLISTLERSKPKPKPSISPEKMDPETVSPRPSVDLNQQNINPIKDKSPDGKIFIPVVRKIGYLMRKTGFLKRWAQQFCVLDRFSLSCYDSETAMRSGNIPNDVIKLHGSSVYDGGLSQTHKSTRIHISTDDDKI